MRKEQSATVEYRENAKKDRMLDLLFFFLLLICTSGVFLFLFSHQTLGSEANYHSDMKAYILEMQGLDSGYSFPYPILFRLGAFFHLFTGAEFAMALATMCLNSLAIVATKVALNKLTLTHVKNSLKNTFLKDQTWVGGVALSILAVSLFFVSMIYLPGGVILPGLRFKYLGVFTSNPFHNATYMAARPFAIPAFLWYVKLLDEYEEGFKKEKLWDYVLFSLALLLATMAKPSFTIVLVGTAGLIMVFRMVKSGFRNFVPTVCLGLCFLPTFADLLYQFKGVFVPTDGAEGGIGFCFGEVWGLYCRNFPAAIALAMGFPLVVLLFRFRDLKTNTLYRFSWQLYLMSFAMAFLLYEKGFRKPDFNFSWGYMYGIFFGFFGSLVVLLTPSEKKNKPPVLWIQWLAYAAHLVCGLYYFWGILHGNMYY